MKKNRDLARRVRKTKKPEEPTLLDPHIAHRLVIAANSNDPVTGHTHSFYRYPARFSPDFARVAILAFSEPGDVVVDPFVGGGTTLVEARALGRLALGVDLNPLATFVARCKTTLYCDRDLQEVFEWARAVISEAKVNRKAKRPTEWITRGYQRNIDDSETWRIRKVIELALDRLNKIPSDHGRMLARAVVLRTAQWALDCRSELPPVHQFRSQILCSASEMITAARVFRREVRKADKAPSFRRRRTFVLTRSVVGLESEPAIRAYGRPKLVLTSPPYPGVHVIYNRWQVLGRRETPAPFWISGALDGNGLSYYTLGERRFPRLKTYFSNLERAYRSIAALSGSETTIVQLLAFSEPAWQLPEFLQVIAGCGLQEVKIPSLANSDDGRLWRQVPNRKWYADQQGETPPSKEVVLFHRLAP